MPASRLGPLNPAAPNPRTLAATHTSIAMQAMASADYDYVPSMAVDPGAVPYTPSMALDPAMPTLLTPSFIRGDTAGILTPTATPMLLNPPPTTTAILTSIGESAPAKPVEQEAPASTPTVTSEDSGLTGKIALGVVAGLLIITALFGGLYLWILRRRRERTERANDHVESRGGSAPFYAFLKVKSRNSDDAHSISSSWHGGPDGVSIWGVGGPLATPPHDPSDLGHASDIGHSSDGHGLMQDPQGGAAHAPDYIPYRGPIEPPRLPEVKSDPIVMSEWKNKNDGDARPASSNMLGLTFDDKAGGGAGGMLRKFSFRRKNSTKKQAGPSAAPPKPILTSARDPAPGPTVNASDNPFDQPIYRPRLDPIPAARVDSCFSIGSSVSGTSAASAATTINAAYNARRTTAQFIAAEAGAEALASLPDLPMPPPPARASTPSLHALNPLSPPVNVANNPHSRALTNHLGANKPTTVTFDEARTTRMSAPLAPLAPVKLAPVPPLRRARTEAVSNKGKVHFAGEPYPFVGYGPRG